MRIKERAKVPSSSEKQAEIDPSPERPGEAAPSSAQVDVSTHRSVPKDSRVRTSLKSLPGLPKLKDDLLAPEALGHANPPDPTPEILSETIHRDSMRSDRAVLGDEENCLSNETVNISVWATEHSPISIPSFQEAPGWVAAAQEAPIQPAPVQNPPFHVVPIQRTSALNAPIQVQCPLANRMQRVDLDKLRIPEPTPGHLQGTPIRPPGLLPLPSPLTPNRRSALQDLQNVQHKTPVNQANMFLSPSPAMVISHLGATPSPRETVPPAPNAPVIPPTPIKIEGNIPGTIGLTPNIMARQPPPLLPRSPRRPPPNGMVPVPIVDGERKDFGVIGDHRAAKNQLQLQVADGPNSEAGSERRAPLEKVEYMQHQRGTGSRSSNAYPKPIYAQNYYVGRYLGGGGMGKVYSAVEKRSLKLHALKVVKRKKLGSNGISFVKAEFTVMKAIAEAKFFTPQTDMRLRFVVHLTESWLDGENVYFVMVCSLDFVTILSIDAQSRQPLCPTSLTDHLREAKLGPTHIKVYAAELVRRLDSSGSIGVMLTLPFLQACGLEALHDMRILHCDLKPDNVLVSTDGHLMISDFGLSVSWLDPLYDGRPSHDFKGRRLAGTDGYMAPELVAALHDPNLSGRGTFGFAADIWSLGIIFAELAMGGQQFMDFESEEEKALFGGKYLNFLHTVTRSHMWLRGRIVKNLRADHAMLVERVSVIPRLHSGGAILIVFPT